MQAQARADYVLERRNYFPWVAREAKKKKPKARTRTRVKLKISSFAIFVLAASLMAGAVMINVTQQALIAQDAAQLEVLQSKLEKERTTYEKLKLEKIKQSSPQRVEALATSRLGMVKPDMVGYIVIPPTIASLKEKEHKNSPGEGISSKKPDTLLGWAGNILKIIEVNIEGSSRSSQGDLD